MLNENIDLVKFPCRYFPSGTFHIFALLSVSISVVCHSISIEPHAKSLSNVLLNSAPLFSLSQNHNDLLSDSFPRTPEQLRGERRKEIYRLVHGAHAESVFQPRPARINIFHSKLSLSPTTPRCIMRLGRGLEKRQEKRLSS